MTMHQMQSHWSGIHHNSPKTKMPHCMQDRNSDTLTKSHGHDVFAKGEMMGNARDTWSGHEQESRPH